MTLFSYVDTSQHVTVHVFLGQVTFPVLMKMSQHHIC